MSSLRLDFAIFTSPYQWMSRQLHGLCRREKDQQGQVFAHVNEAVLFVGLDEQHFPCRHVDGLPRGGEAGSAGRDEVDLVLFMWQLRIGGARRDAVGAEAHAWNTQVFAILRSAITLMDSDICQMLHRVILRL